MEDKLCNFPPCHWIKNRNITFLFSIRSAYVPRFEAVLSSCNQLRDGIRLHVICRKFRSQYAITLNWVPGLYYDYLLTFVEKKVGHHGHDETKLIRIKMLDQNQILYVDFKLSGDSWWFNEKLGMGNRWKSLMKNLQWTKFLLKTYFCRWQDQSLPVVLYCTKIICMRYQLAVWHNR